MDMTALLLTIYVLIWPVIVAATLFVILRAFVRDLRVAKRQGRTII